MRAIYEVETSPADLVANQVTEAQLPMYKKQVPFQVFLILKGELLFPEISFELDMPEKDRDEFGGNVYAMLKDINTRESDLNKQVFALLILKRFISDNPLESQAGGSLASTARQSVSKILTDQLNRLSSNVKGVQLSFDLKSYEDYSSGSASNQTELQLGVSKSLMNDRLIVKVSGNVNLEGEQAQQDSFTDFIGDLALEYKLTEDGRFRITGFRNNNFDMINGNLIETGAGLIYIKDYDSLLELFKANNKKN
jgi:translocation and assembly module TamB